MVYTDNLEDIELDSQTRGQFLDSFGIDEEPFCNRIAAVIRASGYERFHDSHSFIRALIAGFESAYVEQAEVKAMPEALTHSLQRAALVTIAEFKEFSTSDSLTAQSSRLEKEVIPFYFWSVVEVYYLQSADGMDSRASISYKPSSE